MLLGLIRGLEALCDTIEYGPITAVKINTSVCPEAERSYQKVMSGGYSSSSDSPSNIDLDDDKLYPPTPKKNLEQIKKPVAFITASAPINTKVEAEIIMDKPSMSDIVKNVSAGIHEFSIENDQDKQLIKCFILAFYRFNDRIDKDVLDKMLINDDDKLIYVGILRWFESASLGNIKNVGNTMIDGDIVMELKKFLEWELSYIKDQTSAAQAMNIKNGFKDILKNLEDLKEDIIVTPIVSVPEGNLVPKSGFTNEEKNNILKKLEKDFADVLKDHKVDGLLTYKFNVLSEIAELIVMDKDFSQAPAKYRVDPGIIMGNGTNLIYYAMDPDGAMRDIYVNVSKRPQIVKNIIDNPGYDMTQQEIQQALADSFTIKWVYYYIDMSSFSKHLATLKPANMEKLEKKLTAVCNVLYNDNGIPTARMRLKEWNGIDNFTLISDKDCRSPFAMQGSTCRDIIAGMTISVVKDDITVQYKDPNTNKMMDHKFVIKR